MPARTLTNLAFIDRTARETHRPRGAKAIEGTVGGGTASATTGPNNDLSRTYVILSFDGLFEEGFLDDPTSIDEILALDEDGDPILYTVEFDGERETRDGLGRGLVWRATSVDHPFPGDFPQSYLNRN